jgi:multidrug transporter EmrE-like cation transporter
VTEPDETSPEGSDDRAGTEDPFLGTAAHERSVHWLSSYVYGTISTLVAIAGLTFENSPHALTTAGVVVVGAVAIWFAHALSQLVVLPSWQGLDLKAADVKKELRNSWSILVAAIPATFIFILAGVHLFEVKTAFTVAEAVGVLALAVVGFGTAGDRSRPLGRRLGYVGGLVGVGVVIVVLESAVHLL